jgi:peptidoglycan/xylan/chitin deacetylase (PgdA/CDA1 family)
MSELKSRLVISVDLDEWYHARWATGSVASRWPDSTAFFKEVYGMDRPRGDIERPTREILDVFDAFGVRATFFILGEVAGYYPHLVREIAARKHEIACHSYRHVDLSLHSPQSFQRELSEAKTKLEELSGQAVRGFRAPNLVIEDWIIPILHEEGFLYDSSVCPSRKLMGKFGMNQHLPQSPYRLSKDSFRPGAGELVEIPIPVFPYLKLPAATGIATRVLGRLWTTLALRHSLKVGDSLYYFHPYELTAPPEINGLTLYQKLFTRHAGAWMNIALRSILTEFSEVQRMTCADLVQGFAK